MNRNNELFGFYNGSGIKRIDFVVYLRCLRDDSLL